MSDTAFLMTHTDNQCLLSGVLDFTTAREALDKLGALVNSSSQLNIDFKDTGRCNSAALALMIELKAIARRKGHEVSFTNVPEGLQQLATVCQVNDFLSQGR